MTQCHCGCEPKKSWGYDPEYKVFRCSACGGRIDDPPKWLKDKCVLAIKEDDNASRPETK